MYWSKEEQAKVQAKETRAIQNALDLLERRGVLQKYAELSSLLRDSGADVTNHVAISFCPAIKALNRVPWNPWRIDGITVSQNKVFLDSDYVESGTAALAVLLAHELKHVEQYIRWGFKGFACRYSNEILDGNGSGEDNKVEKEAYEFEANEKDLIEAAAD